MTQVNGKDFSFFSSLLGQKVHMKSDCEFFPNFDVVGKIVSISPGNNGETVMTMITANGKTIYIGSNMKNLRYEKC